VLFADNDQDFLDTRSEWVEKAGYQLFKAISPEKAEQILNRHPVHLAIIDIRLRNDNDERDTSGLTLAKKEAYRSIPKIILTRFPSYEYVREALGPALEGLPPAIDFVAKQDGVEALLSAIERAFTHRIQINPHLAIDWRKPLSFSYLANLIEGKTDDSSLADRAEELEDLFRRLFHDSSQITIGQLLTSREGWVALTVFVFSPDGIESQFVVTCGRRADISLEEKNYERFAPKTPGEGSTIRVKAGETMHFAAVAYTLTGGYWEEITPFDEFYRSNPPARITVALNHLFTTNLPAWYRRSRSQQKEKSLNEFFRTWLGDAICSPAKLEPKLKAICDEAFTADLVRLDYSSHRLYLYLAGDSPITYPDPVAYLAEPRAVFLPPFLCGTTHGQLNGNSLLVDRQGRTWLIDFSQAGWGPVIRDFAALETALKFDLLDTLDIQARYKMEAQLLTVTHLDEEIDSTGLEPELHMAVQAIVLLRRQVARVTNHDTNTYLGGLLFYALDHLLQYEAEVRHPRQELASYVHSLLSVAMICQRLSPSPRQDLPAEAFNGLWINEKNKEVQVEGRPVSLTSQQFDLLLYLYQHKGNLCTYTAIAKDVLGVQYKDGTPEDEKKIPEVPRLNSIISRLRKRIELDPEYPKYILTVRGEGYKLAD
jgi:DNA-binding response OmpR family regulator